MPEAKISPLDLNPVGAKTADPKTLPLPTESSKRKEELQKEYVPEDTEPYPIPSDSLSIEYDSSDDIKYIKYKSNDAIKRKSTGSA